MSFFVLWVLFLINSRTKIVVSAVELTIHQAYSCHSCHTPNPCTYHALATPARTSQAYLAQYVHVPHLSSPVYTPSVHAARPYMVLALNCTHARVALHRCPCARALIPPATLPFGCPLLWVWKCLLCAYERDWVARVINACGRVVWCVGQAGCTQGQHAIEDESRAEHWHLYGWWHDLNM